MRDMSWYRQERSLEFGEQANDPSYIQPLDCKKVDGSGICPPWAGRLPRSGGLGSKSTAAVLARFAHIESIPPDWRDWRVNVSNASALARTLLEERDQALLFRTLATLRTDIALFADVDELRWNGPVPAFEALAARLDGAVTGPSKGRPASSVAAGIAPPRRIR